MRLLPVIDIHDGQVVRAVAGQRATYRPWHSPLTPHADPVELAGKLRAGFGWSDAYVADLNALTGGAPQWSVLQRVADAGLRLWLDAACVTPADAVRLVEFDPEQRRLAGIVLGLESVPDPAALSEMVRVVSPPRAVFSLDLFAGRPWTSAAGWAGREATDLARVAWELGVRRLIVLDVSRVGTGGGPGVEELCARLLDDLPDLELVAGGGIRGADDVRGLERAGCRRALVASALHAGQLSAAEVLANNW